MTTKFKCIVGDEDQGSYYDVYDNDEYIGYLTQGVTGIIWEFCAEGPRRPVPWAALLDVVNKLHELNNEV